MNKKEKSVRRQYLAIGTIVCVCPMFLEPRQDGICQFDIAY